MNKSIYEAIIIGAGHAGLSASYFLKQYGIDHIVFDRGRVGESWRSQRWDSFVLNTTNKNNELPGMHHPADDLNSFPSAAEFVSTLERYVLEFQLPVAERHEIISVDKPGSNEYFTVAVSENSMIKKYYSRQVIICSGSQNKISIPSFSKSIPGLVQLHASQYRNAQHLPDGAVLVVGSAQSGCQIADDLVTSGKKVYLSTSMVGRLPGRYRGKDIMDWMQQVKFFEARKTEVTDQELLNMRAPQLAGSKAGRRTISLQALAKKGIVILGTMENADGRNVSFLPNAASHIQFADGFSKNIKEMIDGYILQNQLYADDPQEDVEDIPDVNGSCASSVNELAFRDNNISAIIWATGFGNNFSYIKLPVLDDRGSPEHQDGITDVDGLYFLGLPWLRKRKSGLIYGINEDAEFISEKVYVYSRRHYRLSTHEKIY